MDRILIIEDDNDISALQKDYLNLNGFKVDIISNGTEGLSKALSENYALVIIDIMLPGINGFDICKTIRKSKEIPLIIVSARNDEINKVRGIGFGADDYLTKPFSPNELVARVNGHLNRYKRLQGVETLNNTIVISGITIDKNARRVHIGNKEITLTTKEFELLFFLATNPNIVFSKETLFNRIWGNDEYGDIATVAVHIQKVRKKIEKNPSEPKIIETLWGSGYRFNK